MQGDLSTALQMVERAAAAGTDCVKFQKTRLADKFTGAVLDSPYDGEHGWGKTYGEHKVAVAGQRIVPGFRDYVQDVTATTKNI